MLDERLYRRGKVYYARVPYPDGSIKRVTTRCTDRRAAEAVYRQLERAAAGADPTAANAKPHSLAQALAHFLAHARDQVAEGTLRMYDEKAGHLVRLLGDVDVNLLRVDDVQVYIAERLHTDHAARETVRKELVALRQALALARDRGALVHDPGALVPTFRVRYEPRRRYLAEPEFWFLVRWFEPHRQLWLIVAVYTGARYSEICRLRWEHIDWRQQVIHLPGRKTRKSDRLIPLHPALAHFLAPLREPDGLIVGGWGDVRHALNRATDRLGIGHVTPNDLRRTFASWLVQDGVATRHVAELLGHSSTRMVDLVYGQVDQQTLRRAMERLPAPEWTCAAGVRDESGEPGKRGHDGQRIGPNLDDNRAESVPRAGIEPATRGFSVRALGERKARLLLVKGSR